MDAVALLLRTELQKERKTAHHPCHTRVFIFLQEASHSSNENEENLLTLWKVFDVSHKWRMCSKAMVSKANNLPKILRHNVCTFYETTTTTTTTNDLKRSNLLLKHLLSRQSRWSDECGQCDELQVFQLGIAACCCRLIVVGIWCTSILLVRSRQAVFQEHSKLPGYLDHTEQWESRKLSSSYRLH